MTFHDTADRHSLGVDSLASPFTPAATVAGSGFELHPTDKFLYSAAAIPGCEFAIMVNGREAGRFTVLFEDDPAKLGHFGNVGVRLQKAFRGQDLPTKVTLALLPFLQAHGAASVLITRGHDGGPIERACNLLGATYLDTVAATTDAPERKRFLLDIPA